MAEQQRLSDQLITYWESKKEGSNIPLESNIDGDEISDIWDSCFLIEYEDNKFRYSYLGEDIVEAYGDDLQGLEIVEGLIYPENSNIIENFQNVVDSQEPKRFEGEFTNKNNMLIKYRKTLVPLGDGEKVTYILGGMRWRVD